MNSLEQKSLQPLDRISPSRYTSLKGCAYRVVLANTYKDPLLPFAPHGHLGNVVHEAIRSVLTKSVKTLEEFNAKWQELVEFEENKLVMIGFDFMVPLKKSMKKVYALKKMQVRSLLKTQVSSSNQQIESDISFENEVWLEAKDGSIAGKADLISTINSFVRITDFKSGKILADEGDIKQDYEDQLKLYAYLYYSENNRFPDELVLVDLEKNVYQIEFTGEEIIATSKAAKVLLTKTNALIEQGNSQELSNPSIQNCNFCLYRPACKYHWETLKDENQFYINLKGILESVKEYKNGNVNATIIVNSNNFVVSNIPSFEADILRMKINSHISFYNLFKSDNEGWYKAGRNTMIYED